MKFFEFLFLFTVATLLLYSEVNEASVIDNQKCDDQLQSFTRALAAHELWALQLFDSWGKINAGYFEGNNHNFGSFVECTKFRHELQNEETILGNYCLVNVRAVQNSTFVDATANDEFDLRQIGSIVRSENMELFNAVCLPVTCSPEKVIQFSNQHYFIKADLVGVSAECKTADRRKLAAGDYLFFVTVAFFGLILIASTAYDVYMNYFDQTPNKLFIAFSAYTNGAQLFEIKDTPKAINCLNGLRVLSVFWIMFGHRFTTILLYPTTNSKQSLEFYDNFFSTVMTAYNMPVDTFFVMGAMLVTTSVLSAIANNSLNVPRMIFHRYIRYTPVLAMIVLFVASISDLTFMSPLSIGTFKSRCEKHWWSALLHVQNYVNPYELCANFTWYLSADFQLFLVSPFLIYPAFKYGWKYLWTLPVLALLSTVYVLVMCFINEFRLQPNDEQKYDDYKRFIYYATHSRISPWMFGIVLGYIIHTTKNKKIVISKTLNAILWFISISVVTATVLLAQPLNIPGKESSLSFNAIYIALHRPIWGLAICWIIFACHKLETGGIVRWFLSLKEWQPIARMSLSMYLSHGFYIVCGTLNMKEPTRFEIFSSIHSYWGDIVATLFMSTYLYLNFEVPFMLVERYFFQKRINKSKAKV